MARQRIIPIRREYNRWVANQTLEDYALRFTAKSARQFSTTRISHTAIGAISFLALEAIGGAITLSYGTTNAMVAIVIASIAILAIGLPIARYATRHGVDVDLLTRGASFGYIGSTITSLIYASFTFILFAIEASIMSSALELAFGIPLWLGYIISAVVVIPLVTHGVKLISKFQLLTQPVWIILNILPFIAIALVDWQKIDIWVAFAGLNETAAAAGTFAPFEVAKFGAASAVILALMTQIGEQVDFLRFLPADQTASKWRHRFAIFLAGAGWVVVGAPKLLAGSFLAVLALSHGVAPEHASEPGQMYAVAFGYIIPNETLALILMAVFVVVSQLKINVMNAYAGSLAWSNFFSRLTHSHPGRVVWLLFNVAIALLLMELGIYKLLEATLTIFSIVAMAWLCSISADLFINKPLGLAPPGIEFKRAHLYDINPVGLGSMTISATVALVAHFGAFGPLVASLAPYIALVVALVASPTIAWATKGKYYLARKPRQSWAKREVDHLLDLRASVRAGGHGVVPGLCRADLFAVLLARRALPRFVQTARAHAGAGACRGGDDPAAMGHREAADPYRALQHACRHLGPGDRGAARADLLFRLTRRAGNGRSRRRQPSRWCSSSSRWWQAR